MHQIGSTRGIFLLVCLNVGSCDFLSPECKLLAVRVKKIFFIVLFHSQTVFLFCVCAKNVLSEHRADLLKLKSEGKKKRKVQKQGANSSEEGPSINLIIIYNLGNFR